MSQQPESTAVPLIHGAQNHCFGCGQGNAVGLRLEFGVVPDGPLAGSVQCDANLSSDYEGPPGYLHGGIIATLLDEAMSKANRARGVTAMTRQMQVDYLRPVPSGAPIRIHARVTESQGRKHFTEAQILNSNGTVLAQATGLFIALKT